jgi:hypothetical protein
MSEASLGPEPPTPTLLAISSSLAPASAASKICARLSLRDAWLPPLSSALSAVRSVDPIAYIHGAPLLRGAHQQLNRMAGVSPSTKTFTPSSGSIWPISTAIRDCTADLRPKPTSRNISASARLRFTRWRWCWNEPASSQGNQGRPAASRSSLIRNSGPS